MESTQCNDINVIRMILLVIGVIMTECYYATPGIMFIKYYRQQLPEKYLPTIQILTNRKKKNIYKRKFYQDNLELVDYEVDFSIVK